MSLQSADSAIVRIAGKQEKVTIGETLRVNRLQATEGSSMIFDQVLLLSQKEQIQVGQPLIIGATVQALVAKHEKAPKILVFKRRKRKGFHKKIGFRAQLTQLVIQAITSAEPGTSNGT